MSPHQHSDRWEQLLQERDRQTENKMGKQEREKDEREERKTEGAEWERERMSVFVIVRLSKSVGMHELNECRCVCECGCEGV